MRALSTAVHSPAVYNLNAQKPSDPASYCRAVISMMRDIARCGILIVDEQSAVIDGPTLVQQMLSAIDAWPEECSDYKGKAQAILTDAIVGQKRLAHISAVNRSSIQSCRGNGCHQALNLVDQLKPDLLVGGIKCRWCQLLQTKAASPKKDETTEVVDVHGYATSQFADRCGELAGLVIPHEQWDTKRFDEEVWQPLFRYTRTVQIFDRYIGRHIVRKVEMAPRMESRWKNSLTWIYTAFWNLSEMEPKTFTIHSGLEDWQLGYHPSADEFYQFAENIAQPEKAKLVVHLKEENNARELPHDRYIVTDQAAFVVTRGFDLIAPSGRVYGTTIAPLSREVADELEAYVDVTGWPDIPVFDDQLLIRCRDLEIV